MQIYRTSKITQSFQIAFSIINLVKICVTPATSQSLKGFGYMEEHQFYSSMSARIISFYTSYKFPGLKQIQFLLTSHRFYYFYLRPFISPPSYLQWSSNCLHAVYTELKSSLKARLAFHLCYSPTFKPSFSLAEKQIKLLGCSLGLRHHLNNGVFHELWKLYS